jgi:hypothetical protein
MLPQPYGAPDEPLLLVIGDVSVTQSSVIVPQGRFPLRGTSWTVQDNTVATQAIPTWAIVMTVVFVWFCFLGLLFLLAKETRYGGNVTITVMGPNGLYHIVQLPPGPENAMWANQRVNEARAITANAY